MAGLFKTRLIMPHQVMLLLFVHYSHYPIKEVNIIFHDMNYYNPVLDLFEQDVNTRTYYESSRTRVVVGGFFRIKIWIKIIVDAFRKYDLYSTTIEYVIRDINVRVLMTCSKNLRHCLLLVA